MTNPAKTLKDILAIIHKDVLAIKRGRQDGRIDPADALTLTRYASALDDIVKNTEKEKEKLKKDFSKLDTDALIQAYKEEKNGNKS